MSSSAELKQFILDSARSLGFERAVVASLEPLTTQRQHFEEWLSLGYAAGMDYLKRNPHFRTSPQLLFPGSLSAIIASVSYYSEPPERPGLFFGRVARYAVGLDYHAVLRQRLRQLRELIEKKTGTALLGKPYTDDVALYEQGFAARHGLGFAGKNTMIIGPKLLGSYYLVGELFTDLPLEPDEPYRGTCGSCFRCGNVCPTEAIVDPYFLDSNRCISYLTIENKGGIPLELRAKLGEWVFGCDVCQEVCPYNQRPPLSPWQEFHPSSGVGHHLDLFSVLDIKSQEEFRSRFEQSPLRRPKLRGLTRNALVVIGNVLARGEGEAIERQRAIERLVRFAKNQPDDMLQEHAYWAIAQADVLN